MIAYNNTWLGNLFIQRESDEAYHENCLAKEEWENIKVKYPVHFYTPNFFIRIGLFLLTAIILVFSFGLFTLLFMSSIEHAIGGLAIFFALLAYTALEYMVQTKKHYQSGVDDALLWISAATMYAGIYFATHPGNIAACAIIFIISVYCSLRFTDAVMSIVAFISLLCICFFICAEAGSTTKTFVPFILMAVSFLIYFFTMKVKGLQSVRYYAQCLNMIEIAALLSFYLAGNYFAVRELSDSMFHLNLAANESIPFGWLFWLFTTIIPVLYLLRGIQKKDAVLLRVGLLLIAVIIFTVRYYHSVAPVEIMMTLGGIGLIGLSYVLIRYLREPRHGFTYKETRPAHAIDKLQIESLILAETFAGQPAPPDTTSFGGGSFGGGGASGEY